MSGIYIKGMEMPEKCVECRLMRRCGKDDLDFVCQPARIYVEDLTNAMKPRPDWCPLVPVQPHGRLIDADELYSVLRKRAKEFSDSEYGDGVKCGLADAREYIKIAPTIIPADPAEEEEA